MLLRSCTCGEMAAGGVVVLWWLGHGGEIMHGTMSLPGGLLVWRLLGHGNAWVACQLVREWLVRGYRCELRWLRLLRQLV
jgi:hypothetical protein